MTDPRRFVRAAAVAAAVVYLGIMAWGGRGPDQAPESSRTGLMRREPAAIDRIELVRGERRSTFRRDASARWTLDGSGAPLAEAPAGLLDKGLGYLRSVAPVRTLGADETQGLPAAEFGLDPAALVVMLHTQGQPVLVARFGRSNAQQLQYLRIDGEVAVHLMSGFVGETWSQAAEAAGGAR